MTPRGLVLVGGGEHAVVVADAARSSPEAWTLVGFVDPSPGARLARELGLPCLGSDTGAGELLARPELSFVLGLGGTGVAPLREAVAGRYRLEPARWARVVHARATVSPAARLDPGVVVMAGAVVNAGAHLGAHAIVNTGAVVEHHVHVADFGHVGPGAVVGGGTVVGRGAYLGLGCRVRDHLRLGQGVTVGMGAIVVRDVADGATVLGVPARERA